MKKVKFKCGTFLPHSADLKRALEWWEQKPLNRQVELAKKEDLVTYADLVAFYLEQNK